MISRTTSPASLALCLTLGLTAGAVGQDASPAPERPRLALALSGGGARGIAHIGALRALEEAGVPVDAIVANSMGAVVGGIYATGRTADRAGADRPVDGLGVALQRSARPAHAAGGPAGRPLRFDGRGELRLEVAAPAGRPARRAPHQPLPDREPRRRRGYAAGDDFDRLPDPVPGGGGRPRHRASRSSSRRATSRARCARACRSRSSSRPVDWEGRKLVDGLIVNNLPIDVAKAFGACGAWWRWTSAARPLEARGATSPRSVWRRRSATPQPPPLPGLRGRGRRPRAPGPRRPTRRPTTRGSTS